MKIQNKHPIDRAFQIWINNHPESSHPLDTKRFYIFVKTFCRYSRLPNGEEYHWLKNRLKNETNLSSKKINHYCDEFIKLKNFNKERPIPTIELRD